MTHALHHSLCLYQVASYWNTLSTCIKLHRIGTLSTCVYLHLIETLHLCQVTSRWDTLSTCVLHQCQVTSRWDTLSTCVLHQCQVTSHRDTPSLSQVASHKDFSLCPCCIRTVSTCVKLLYIGTLSKPVSSCFT